jgi:hypothetical protein
VSVHNLKQVRKRKAKADAEKQADANRVAHGLSLAQRNFAKTTRDRQTKALNNHILDKS